MPTNPELWLRPGADRRLTSGHCWIYSNEIDSKRSPLPAFAAGDPVTVYSASGKALASAYMEPHALICARLVSRRADLQLTADLAAARVRAALALRTAYFSKPFYRLVYGDSDGLPGMVADRFGDYLVVQLNTLGIERYAGPLIDAMVSELAPRGILIRRDSRNRQEQALEVAAPEDAQRKGAAPESAAELVYGEVPAQVELEENGCRFHVPVYAGQKTGWFYDHRDNRAALAGRARDRRVLDVFSYTGGWGVQAARAGARTVTCVDNSAPALELAEKNARLNGVEKVVAMLQGRADTVLQELAARGEQFDVVVLDPPAFVQRRRDLAKGRKAYQRINALALGVLAPRGVLISASCSMHLSEQDLLFAMGAAARRCGRQLRITGFGGQAADHPVLPLVPETRYLKAVFAEVSPAD